MDVPRGRRQCLGALQGGSNVADNLYLRGGIWWGRVQVAKKERRRSLRTSSKPEARKRFKDWKDSLDHALFYGRDRLTWQDAVLRYCEEVMPSAIKPSTAKRYLVSFRQVRGRLDGKHIDMIGRKDIADLIGYRKRVATNATVIRDLTAVSRVFASAIGWGVCEHNPALEYDRSLVRERRDPIALPTAEEVQKAATAPSTFGRLIAFASQTGMRQGEILGLTWRQIELNRGVITLDRTKTDSPRAIPLQGPMLAEAVGTLNGTARHPTSPLVFYHGEGQPYRNFAAQFRAWRRRQDVAFRFHDLRHYFAVMYLRGGGYIYDLQGILGHASIKTTEGYLRYLTPAEKQRAMHPTAHTSAQIYVRGAGASEPVR